MASKPTLYEPALDGLRLVAFLAVFLHHLPGFATSGIQAKFNSHGWAGVELFFVISTYLLFKLMDAEYAKTGDVSIRNFYMRRVLRIYPLMVLFSAAMFILASDHGWAAIGRLIGIATFTDNIVTAVLNYNVAVPATAHLWTLGFEAQIYLVLPLLFIAWKRHGTRRFLIGIGAFYAVCVVARFAITAAGAPHPLVWVTPILQPDGPLVGLILATGILSRRLPPMAWLVLSVVALIGFLMIRVPWSGPFRSVFSYMFIAVASGALVQAVRTVEPLRRFFSLKPIVYLGTISFGLYVFHALAIQIGMFGLARLTGSPSPKTLSLYWALNLFALSLTIVLSAASYHFVELPFLRLKDRFSIVFGRERLASESLPEKAEA